MIRTLALAAVILCSPALARSDSPLSPAYRAVLHARAHLIVLVTEPLEANGLSLACGTASAWRVNGTADDAAAKLVLELRHRGWSVLEQAQIGWGFAIITGGADPRSLGLGGIVGRADGDEHLVWLTACLVRR